MRVVLDTNVFVSALLSPKGPPANLIRGWRQGLFTVVVSDLLLDEIRDVLLRPRFAARLDPEQVNAFVGMLRGTAEVVEDPESEQRLAPDPSDDFLVALAISSGADMLVTGDALLTQIKGLQLPVLTPRELIDLLVRMEP